MLTVDSPIRLGEVKLNYPTVFNVIVTNRGSEDIKIYEIFAGCQSCTTVSITKPLVGANDNTNVNIVFTPKTTGVHDKTVTLKYKLGNEEARTIINFTATVSE